MLQALDTEVLIVGGGPSGMVAALCLARRGIASLIVERSQGIQTHPKAHVLSGRSVEILHGLGISYDELLAEASPLEDGSRILFCNTIGKEFGCIDLTSGAGARKYRQSMAAPFAYLNLSQVEVEKLLLARVRVAPGLRILYSHQWESFLPDAEWMRSRITDRTTGKEISIRSRYVICADGAASRCRKALGIAMDGPEMLGDFVNAYFEADLSRVVTTRGKLYFIFNPQVAGSVFIAHHIEKRWVFQTRVATPHERMEDYTDEVMRERIFTALGRRDVDFRIRSMSTWRMTAQLAAHYRSGRAFLMGDAAHRFPPTGGLGMNTGIGDAHNLCWKLAEVLQRRAPESLLDSYETERRPIARINCDESRSNFARMFEIATAFGADPTRAQAISRLMQSQPVMALPAPMHRWLRDQLDRRVKSVLARYDNDATVRSRVLAAIAAQRSQFDLIGIDLGYAYEEGALVADGSAPIAVSDPVSDYRPSTRPGARFPHFWLDAHRQTRSSHELFDYGRSTLLLGDSVRRVEAGSAALDEVAERLGLRLVSLAGVGVPLAHQAAVHTHCEITAEGALLIRPDGHVAWRQARRVILSPALLESIVSETYG